jgi:hypothetical protein
MGPQTIAAIKTSVRSASDRKARDHGSRPSAMYGKASKDALGEEN